MWIKKGYRYSTKMLKTDACSAHWSTFSSLCQRDKGCLLFLVPPQCWFYNGRTGKVTQHVNPPFSKMLIMILSSKVLTRPCLKMGNLYYHSSSYDGRYAEHQGSGFRNEMKKDQKNTIWICL